MSRHDARKKYGDKIQAHVDAAPPLTPAQRAQLAAIFASARPVADKRKSKNTAATKN